jgi:hypothetical protein
MHLALGGTAKVAMRYQVSKGFRLEGGLGAADGGDGGDLNGDLVGVIGTNNPSKTWNYYMSLRLGASRGCVSCGASTNHAPGALVPLGAIGTTARISDNAKFLMKTGLGGIFSRQYPAPAGYLHLSFGISLSLATIANQALPETLFQPGTRRPRPAYTLPIVG